MNKTHEAYGKIVAGLVTWGILLVCGMLTTYYGAYVLGYHWQWFLVPEGFDVPSMRARIGMMLIAGLFSLGTILALSAQTAKYGLKNEESNERLEAAGRIGAAVIGITVSWGIGWLWNWWLN
jgi:hypothetical protein